MKKLHKNPIVTLLLVSSVLVTFGITDLLSALAATSPSLNTAGAYGVLATTFQHNGGTTTITGDVGYAGQAGTGPLTISGATQVNNAAWTQAGVDQNNTLSTGLAPQSCDFNFGSATDLSLLSQPLAPGVYCITGAASIGTGGITLSGTGTYIFRITGALTTVANSNVLLANSASSCDVFWTPGQATTLGANSTFIGNDIDASGITVGSTTTWTGRALAYGGTVTTDTDTINSTCTTASPAPGNFVGTVTVVKTVVNDNGGTKTIADFPLFINGLPVVSGVAKSLSASSNLYTMTETSNPNYTATFSGDCDVNGRLYLHANENKFCIITNNDIGAPAVVPPVPPIIDVVKVPSPLALPAGPGPVTYTYTLHNIGTVPVTNLTMVGDSCSPITLVSGDVNGDSILQVNETWTYTCSMTLSATHTNTVVATGWANGITATDIASATVVVGIPVVPPLIHVTKVPNPLALATAGGTVVYTEKITNPGTVALSNVTLTDDKCSPMTYISGDTNGDSMLPANETWTYTCSTNLTQTTTNTATASGTANGMTARDFAVATVVVAAPKLPSTGVAPDENTIPWNIIALAGILTVISSSFVVMRKKRTV